MNTIGNLPTNGWDVLIAMLPTILSAIAAAGTILATALGVQNGRKTDHLHGMLNSELDKFKSDQAAAYELALAQGIALAVATSERKNAALVAAAREAIVHDDARTAASLELRIAALERQLPPPGPDS